MAAANLLILDPKKNEQEGYYQYNSSNATSVTQNMRFKDSEKVRKINKKGAVEIILEFGQYKSGDTTYKKGRVHDGWVNMKNFRYSLQHNQEPTVGPHVAIRPKTAIRAGVEMDSDKIETLCYGDVVNVEEIVESENRLRGRLENGWATTVNHETGAIFLQPITEEYLTFRTKEGRRRFLFTRGDNLFAVSLSTAKLKNTLFWRILQIEPKSTKSIKFKTVEGDVKKVINSGTFNFDSQSARDQWLEQIIALQEHRNVEVEEPEEPEEEEYIKMLREWNLEDAIPRFEEDHWTDVKDWGFLGRDDLSELGLRGGQIPRFLREVESLMPANEHQDQNEDEPDH